MYRRKRDQHHFTKTSSCYEVFENGYDQHRCIYIGQIDLRFACPPYCIYMGQMDLRFLSAPSCIYMRQMDLGFVCAPYY